MAEAKTTRVVREGTVDKQDFFEIMSDRRWYTLSELIVRLKPMVSPELAAQHFIKNANRRARDEGEEPPESHASYAEKVNRGRRVFIRKRLLDAVRQGYLAMRKTGPGDDDIEISWQQWSCWSCSKLMNGHPLTPNKLCEECSEIVESPSDENSIARLRQLFEDAMRELEQLKREKIAKVAGDF